METTQNEEIEIDLREIFFLLLNKAWLILLSAVLGAVGFFVYTYLFIQPIYQSQSMICILSKTTSLTSLADIQLGTQLTNDYMVLIKSRPVVEKVIDNLGLSMEYNELNKNITITNPNNTRILEITVSNEEAEMAQAIVNELTDVSVERVADVMATDKPNIVDYGHIADAPSSPNLMKNALIGAFLLAVITAGIVIVTYLMNDSIKTSEDVEKYLGLNTLGTIPLEEGTNKKETWRHDKDAKKMMKSKRNKTA